MKFFKFLLFLVIFLSFSICNLAFIISLSIAASAVPAPGVIPCDQTRDPEFDPTRPYQASPCGDSPKAFFCSNSVVLTIGSVSTPYEGPGWQSCKGRCSGGPIDITVDLSNAQLPVLGNSQDKNIDSATKMNEYVNAYLGEPTKKLLPQTIQEAQRIAIIETTKTETTSEADDAGKTQKEPANHNQIVVCYDKPIAILPWFTNLFGIEAKGLGKAVPKDCHDDKHEYTLRLQNWDNTKFDVLYQAIQKWILDHHFYPADFISQIIASASIDRWPKKIPPLPWEFTDPEKYTKAYNEWRGDLCAYINVPILGKKLVCIGIPGVTNSDYADLFPYIPLANTVDKIAGQTVNSVEIKSDGANFKSKGYTEVIAPKLYFAHTQEDFDLSSLLQKTFKAEGVAEALPQPLPKDVQQNSTCQILKSYTNPGDDLTFDEPKKSLKVTGIYYEVSEIKCPDDVDRKKKCTDPNDPKTCKDIAPDCSADVTVTIPMDNKSPYLNEIWDTTVAGNQSIFRRIYPKTGPEAPISCIADIPGVSKVTYASDKQNIDKVTEPDGSSVGGGSKSVDAQFYFPHLGSISDYFLKGIQTALRPKGYGEALPAGLCSNNLACGDLTNLPKAKESSCNLGSVSPRIEDIPQSLKQIVSLAADTYKVPPNLILGVMYGEGAFNRDSQGKFSKFDWTDENVKAWATCTNLPNCSGPGTSVVPFFGNYWDTLAKKVGPDLLKIDPNRKNVNPCNLLDATFVLAKDLQEGAGGGSNVGQKCFGITMTSSIPTSCDWKDNGQYESAIKMWENGNDLACYTKQGSCQNGPSAGTCSVGDPNDPDCETVGNHSSDPSIASHTACVWDVGHGK